MTVDCVGCGLVGVVLWIRLSAMGWCAASQVVPDGGGGGRGGSDDKGSSMSAHEVVDVVSTTVMGWSGGSVGSGSAMGISGSMLPCERVSSSGWGWVMSVCSCWVVMVRGREWTEAISSSSGDVGCGAVGCGAKVRLAKAETGGAVVWSVVCSTEVGVKAVCWVSCVDGAEVDVMEGDVDETVDREVLSEVLDDDVVEIVDCGDSDETEIVVGGAVGLGFGLGLAVGS